MTTEIPKHLAERLVTEGDKTQKFFESLTPDEWQLKVYPDGTQWCIQQILAHFVASEVAFNHLISNILAGGEGAPEDFDIDVFNEREVLLYKNIPNSDLLELFNSYRKMNVTLIGKMSLEDLKRAGRHPFLGIAPLVDIIKLIYRHNQIHQRDIRRLVADDCP
jgi:hypothetical protein